MSTANEFVLDASMALAWCFPDERAPRPKSVMDALAMTRAFVPSLWPLEIANALLIGERRGRSTQADTGNWIAFLKALPISIDLETHDRVWTDALNLGRLWNLSVHDASYLELALRGGCPLATLDCRLQAVANSVGVPKFEPAGGAV